jgi:hypothetical protein
LYLVFEPTEFSAVGRNTTLQFTVVTPGTSSWGREGAGGVHPAGGARIGDILRRPGDVGDRDLAHGAPLAMQYGT